MREDIDDVLFTLYGKNKARKELAEETTDLSEHEQEYDVKKDYEAFFTSDNPFDENGLDQTRRMDKIESPEQRETPEFSEQEFSEPVIHKSGKSPKKIAAEKRRAEALRKRQRRRREHMRTFTHIFGSILLIIFIVSVSSFLALFIVRAALDFTGINLNENVIQVDIPEGATTEEIAQILYNPYNGGAGIINMPDLFCFYSRISGKDGGYLHGLFTLNTTMSYSQIINTLQNEAIVSETADITVIEGMTARQIGLLLEENYVCRASDFENYYKNKMNKYDFERRVLQDSRKFYQLEGYLFPDKYTFYTIKTLMEDEKKDVSEYAEIAAKKMFSNFNSKITPEMYKKINEMGLTLDEFMALASMVQLEAGSVEDMGLVASVFINRLKNPDIYPKLESDVTVIYGNENIKPHITEKNTGIYTPILNAYNTYETRGLPPGPICNPGLDAMNAVLNAPKTDYFYFCANPETLEMYYAENLAEHEKNVEIAGAASVYVH